MSPVESEAPATPTLDPLTLPLWGSRLIEASAGTGKTWTIAALVLRLVLGHGEPGRAGAVRSAFGRPLQPAEILVLSFTRAATRELSDRIRARLVEAARCFRGLAVPAGDDGFLAALMDAYPAGPERRAAAWRLASAAENMDQAAVLTIDAWCQRMLREHAFDSGSPLDEELAADESALRNEAALDYWRQQVYPLGGAVLDQALAVWPSAQALVVDAGALAARDLPEAAGQGPLGALIERLLAEREVERARLKQGWSERAGQMHAWLLGQLNGAACPFDRVKLKRNWIAGWIQAIVAWAEDPLAARPDLETGAWRLTPAGLLEVVKPGQPAPALPGHFAAFEALMQALDRQPRPATPIRLHAAAAIARRLEESKRQAARFGFNDLLRRLDAALDPARHGDAAERLRARILAQTPVALIDEFQDTSPLQARIFDRLFDVQGNPADAALLLIGDPKQSIYRFRGADIHSYLAARQATRGRHFVLGTNHRSTNALVAAVNHLFEQAERRAGEGAFMYRETGNGGEPPGSPSSSAPSSPATAAPSNPVPFVAVAARGRAEAFVSSSGAEPALRLVLDAALSNNADSQARFAELCAERIVALLGDPQAGFEPPEAATAPAAFRRLRPADIAVLVRTGLQAGAVRQALRSRGVASVYLSDRDSVFDSPEAQDVLRWLRAVASPRDARLLRAAFATRTAGWTIESLLQLASDDAAFDARSEQLRRLQAVWRQQGVLAMLRRMLHELDLPGRWLGRPQVPDAALFRPLPSSDATPAMAADADGERCLTNLLHLAELLQAASSQVEGEHALIRWLAGRLAGSRGAGAVTDKATGVDDQILRLESDADLVQVVTVHKSKGLEYPLVFLPFASSFRGVDRRTPWVEPVDASGRRSLVLQPDPAQLAAADRERQREDQRLLYVALTRARFATWVGIAALRHGQSRACTWPRSAIGWLLTGARAVDSGQLQAAVEAVIQPCREIELMTVDARQAVPCTRLPAQAGPGRWRALRPYHADFERHFGIGSFSGLVRSLAGPDLAASNSALAQAAIRDDEPPPPRPDAGAPLEPAGEPGLTAVRPPPSGGRAGAAELESPPPAAPGPGPGVGFGTGVGAGVGAIAAPAGAAPWHAFPRGALPGNFLHDQLEWLAGEGFGLARSASIEHQLRQRCERQGWGHRAAEIVEWLGRLVALPLPHVGVALQALAGPWPEMEFWFPSAGVPTARIDALCRAHLLGGRDRPALPERELLGMVMGFADLVFEHGGRWWVLDYKSNHLGAGDADYGAAALEAAMAEHRYDVQAALYLLALHRLLRSRLGAAYDPRAQLGGAIYFFLRGWNGPARGCHLVAGDVGLLDALDAAFSGTAEFPA